MRSYLQKVVIIIFNNKMTNNYVWNTDKQNKYNLDSASSRPKGSITTNNALRKKIEENLTLAERDKNYQIQANQHNKSQNYKIEEYNFNQVTSSKRDNARKRGFDMRVSNIENINEKIAGLLSMVNKDKTTQKEQNKEMERSSDYELRARQKTPPPYQNNDKIKNLSNKSNNASGKKYLNQESKLYKYSDPKVDNFQRKKAVSTFQASQIVAQTSEIPNIKQIRMNFYEQERKKRDNEIGKFTPNRKQKLQESSWVDQSFREKQSKRFDLKAAGRTRQEAFQKIPKSQYQKMDIQKMIEERRKHRFTYGESERDLSPSIVQKKSTLKTDKDNKQGQIKYNKQKESPIQAVKGEFSYTQNYAQEHHQEMYRNNHSPAKGHSSRQSDLYNFSKLSYVEEEPIRQKRNAPNTRMIDEQLNKIKTKIIESETNKKKIERFKPTNEFQNEGEASKTHTCRIANSISSQVEVDSNLRASRDSFCKMPGESKWSQLQNIALQKGLNLRRDQLKQLITIGADEHNPFVSQKSNISMQQFVTLLVASQKNWEHMVMKCASARSLMSENFDVKDLDLSGKGYLALEDIVCFVNLYSNTFYRNRDLALVMRRLQMAEGESRKGGIEYKTFLATFMG